MYNQVLAEEVREAFPDLDLYLPQENVSINDKTAYANSEMIAKGDDDYLKEADFLISVIDGETIDAGVACEIGYYSSFPSNDGSVTFGRPIFALHTDVRQMGRDNRDKINALIEDGNENQFIYKNLYVIGKIKNSGGKIVSSIEDLIFWIKAYQEAEIF